ncbi:MAG: NUDIX domain-containing protein [Halomonas sp.]|nr:NUDIX domain-containing protein [Halomonas sp.]MDN6297463.1 NUDIX domain-containing protein [Halomonas sp.]MDN6314778.1 NUDIX domain-containing protein [Halomonas sp.]MDN6336152.1 NUDIX domain-containing protein [Halomonas sp.]
MSADSQRPQIRATVACVIQRDGRYLVVEEDRGGPLTLYNQPAGHIEVGEGPIAAVRREVAEETAWDVTLTGYLGLYVFQLNDLTFHSHGFIATPARFLDTPLDDDIQAAHWLTLDELKALDAAGRMRSPLVLPRVEDALTGRVFPLGVIHER